MKKYLKQSTNNLQQNCFCVVHYYKELKCYLSLSDETYTKEEVKSILINLEQTLTNEIKCELSAFTNTNLLMMYQFFQQAEKWHLRLNANISEMQNKYALHFKLNYFFRSKHMLGIYRELLQEMEKIESHSTMHRVLDKKKLLPMTDHITNDFAEMLHKRLEQLESHNFKLEKDLKCLEDNVRNVF